MSNDEFTLRRPPVSTPALYGQEGKGYQAIVHAHYFIGATDWLVTEYDPQADLAFGWVCLNGDRINAELGYTSLSDVESVRARGVFTVDYDEHWRPIPLEQAIAELDRRQGRG